MGTSSTTSDTSSSTKPWEAAMPTVQSLFSNLNSQMGNTGVTSAEQIAIDNLTARGAAGNQFAAPAAAAATSLLNGGGATDQNATLQKNLDTYTQGMSNYTDPNYSTLNSPQVRAALDAINTNTSNSTNSQFAAAGRSGSGLSAKTLAQSVASAEAPTILNQANLDTTTRQNALNGVYGAGNTTSGAITANNQTGNTNKVAGITAANSATNMANQGDQQVLQAQELLKSIPSSALATLSSIGIPLASLGTDGTSHTDTTSTPSLLSQIQQGASMFSGGSNSAISGLTNAGSGAASSLGSLAAMAGK